MAETTEKTTEKKLSVAGAKTLTLKGRGVEQGVVRQSFSHGRSKAVVVEKVKTRIPTRAKGDTAIPAAAPAKRSMAAASAVPAVPVASPATATPAVAPKPSGVVLRTLTEEERSARARALGDARLREAEERRIAEEEALLRKSRETVERSERDAAEARKAEEERRRKHDLETKLKAEQEAKKRFGDEATHAKLPGRPALEPDEEEAPRARRGAGAARAAPAPKPARGTAQKNRGRLTVVTALSADEERERSVAAFRRRVQRLKGQAADEPKEKLIREVTIPETITIQELANRMAERAVDVIKLLMKQGHMAQINDVIDADTAQLLAEELGHTVKRVAESDVEEGLFDVTDDPSALLPRPAVVTVMGHVDHGKTSLLDAIRSTEVAAGEAGGITQHIGAYQVTSPSGSRITFIDTPGHAAFTAMRARGAKVTDIVVLVVAADDGVMPQTVEAINHAKAAEVPLIVAINKMDKPGADPQRVRTDLLQHEVIVESMSGETLEVEVSALKRTGIEKLLESILLQAELLDLKANPNRSAEGVIIEAKLERGRGPVGTVLVQRGSLHIGDIIVAGTAWGRVRALIDDRGEPVGSAGPSVPVEILGFDSAPEAGDPFAVVENEGRARELTDYRARKRRQTLGAAAGSGRTLEQMMQQLKESGRKEFPLVVKGDVQGSVEAIVGALRKLGTDEVEARIVHSGVGGITESDIVLAGASKAVVLGFNVRANVQAKAAADQAGAEIRYYNIIYDLVDDVKAAMSGLLAPTIREVFLGNARILEVFNISKVGKVAGCRVTEGKVERGARVRLIRDNVVIHEGTLSTLKRFKDEVKEVPAGQECGMAFANYQDIREGDTIECFTVETIKRTL
jgi:translation initiation factor IF-2